jgi:hypothetical protein
MITDDTKQTSNYPEITHYGTGSGTLDFYYSAKKAAHEAAGWRYRSPNGTEYLFERTALCTFRRCADHSAGTVSEFNVSIPSGTDVNSVRPFWDDLVKVGSGKIQRFGYVKITITHYDGFVISQHIGEEEHDSDRT